MAICLAPAIRVWLFRYGGVTPPAPDRCAYPFSLNTTDHSHTIPRNSMKMLQPRRAWIVAVILASACVSPSRGGRAPDGAPMTLHVANYNWRDFTLYAVRGGARWRVGRVGAQERARFVLPEIFTQGGKLQLWAKPLGGGQTLLTEPLWIVSGGAATLRIENHLPLSILRPQR